MIGAKTSTQVKFCKKHKQRYVLSYNFIYKFSSCLFSFFLRGMFFFGGGAMTKIQIIPYIFLESLICCTSKDIDCWQVYWKLAVGRRCSTFVPVRCKCICNQEEMRCEGNNSDPSLYKWIHRAATMEPYFGLLENHDHRIFIYFLLP